MSFWQRIAFVRIWLASKSRPQFYYAIDVLFQASLYTATMTLLVLVFNLFGLGYVVNYGLIGHLVGPLAMGALVAGYLRYRIPDSYLRRGWIVAGSYGGVTVMVFALLIEFSAAAASIGFGVGVLFFWLLHWLFEIEARKARAA